MRRRLHAVSVRTLLAAGALGLLLTGASACFGEAQSSPPATTPLTAAAPFLRRPRPP